MKTLFILFLGIVLAISTIVMISFKISSKNDSSPAAVSPPVSSVDGEYGNQQEIVPVKDTVVSFTGKIYSSVALKQDVHTEPVTEGGLYKNTVSEEYYNIFYFEPSGTITILLYKEPLSLARSLAEQQLKQILPNSDEEFCDMQIKVWVNENVNKEHSSRNLGLSFCPNSASI